MGGGHDARRLADLLPEPIDDVLKVVPFPGAEAEGVPTLALAYRCYERRGERCAWTHAADATGHHHGLLLRMTLQGWVVVADEEFATEDAARTWAARLWALGRGLSVDDLA